MKSIYLLLSLLLTGVVVAQPIQPDTTLPLLLLEDVLLMVLEQNPDLAIARLEQEIAERQATYGATGFLPSLALSANQRGVPTTSDDRDYIQTLDVSVTGSIRIFDGFSRSARLERLRTLAELATLDTDALTIARVAEVQIAYFNIVQQQQRLMVLLEAVDLSEERLRIATGRRDEGAASDLEVNRAQVDLNADQAALLRQETILIQAKAQLNQLLHRPEDTRFRVESTIALDETLPADELRTLLLSQSPILRAEHTAQQAADLEITAIRREFWPRLELQAGYAFSELTEPLLPPGQIGGFSYGLTATFDLFDGFDRQRRLQVARLRSEQQSISTQRTQLALLTAFENAFVIYEQSLRLVELEEQNVEAARSNAVVALERFRLGVSTSIELREVQRALIDAESRLVTARFEAKAAEIELRMLAGE